jgi:hypothetical protein
VLASTLPSLTYPSLKLRQPIFVGTGQSDQDVLAANQLKLVKEACEAGTTIEAHLYSGLDHSGTVMASLKHSVPFVRKIMSGDQVGAVPRRVSSQVYWVVAAKSVANSIAANGGIRSASKWMPLCRACKSRSAPSASPGKGPRGRAKFHRCAFLPRRGSWWPRHCSQCIPDDGRALRNK